ncbi:hypothetical protein DIPPA_07965 [Diplonema papillatum]|nr:hypothetical protein DIPPA_07965 [Diplonema papillatum]
MNRDVHKKRKGAELPPSRGHVMAAKDNSEKTGEEHAVVTMNSEGESADESSPARRDNVQQPTSPDTPAKTKVGKGP